MRIQFDKIQGFEKLFVGIKKKVMPNIFEIYVNGYRALGHILTDGVRDVAEWSDKYIGEQGTDIVVNYTIIDRSAATILALTARHPSAKAIQAAMPAMKDFAKAGFALVGRGKSFRDAVADRVLSHALDPLTNRDHAPEVRGAYKALITECLRHKAE